MPCDVLDPIRGLAFRGAPICTPHLPPGVPGGGEASSRGGWSRSAGGSGGSRRKGRRGPSRPRGEALPPGAAGECKKGSIICSGRQKTDDCVPRAEHGHGSSSHSHKRREGGGFTRKDSSLMGQRVGWLLDYLLRREGAEGVSQLLLPRLGAGCTEGAGQWRSPIPSSHASTRSASSATSGRATSSTATSSNAHSSRATSSSRAGIVRGWFWAEPSAGIGPCDEHCPGCMEQKLPALDVPKSVQAPPVTTGFRGRGTLSEMTHTVRGSQREDTVRGRRTRRAPRQRTPHSMC